jgi:hypothetical protein
VTQFNTLLWQQRKKNTTPMNVFFLTHCQSVKNDNVRTRLADVGLFNQWNNAILFFSLSYANPTRGAKQEQVPSKLAIVWQSKVNIKLKLRYQPNGQCMSGRSRLISCSGQVTWHLPRAWNVPITFRPLIRSRTIEVVSHGIDSADSVECCSVAMHASTRVIVLFKAM